MSAKTWSRAVATNARVGSGASVVVVVVVVGAAVVVVVVVVGAAVVVVVDSASDSAIEEGGLADGVASLPHALATIEISAMSAINLRDI